MSRYDWIKCSVEGCSERQIQSFKLSYNPNKYCRTHRNRWLKHGHINPTRQAKFQGRHLNMDGYVKVYREGKYQYEHIILAEKALGRKLPTAARVHHMNEKRDDNYSYCNLVICPSESYHKLLHSRMEALKCEQ